MLGTSDVWSTYNLVLVKYIVGKTRQLAEPASS